MHGQLGGQPGLAGTGLADQHRERRRAGVGPREQGGRRSRPAVPDPHDEARHEPDVRGIHGVGAQPDHPRGQDAGVGRPGLDSHPAHRLRIVVGEQSRTGAATLAIRIDLTAVFLCIKHQAKAMVKAGGGAIVNTASSLGQVGLAGASEYCAAKHGVIGLTRAAGADYGARGIRVNAILPGITRTPMIARLSEDPQLSAVFDRLKLRHSMHRFGEPNEIGDAVASTLIRSA